MIEEGIKGETPITMLEAYTRAFCKAVEDYDFKVATLLWDRIHPIEYHNIINVGDDVPSWVLNRFLVYLIAYDDVYDEILDSGDKYATHISKIRKFLNERLDKLARQEEENA